MGGKRGGGDLPGERGGSLRMWPRSSSQWLWRLAPARARSLLGGTRGGHERTTAVEQSVPSYPFVSRFGPSLGRGRTASGHPRPFGSFRWAKFCVWMTQTDKMGHPIEVALSSTELLYFSSSGILLLCTSEFTDDGCSFLLINVRAPLLKLPFHRDLSLQNVERLLRCYASERANERDARK